MSPYLPGRSRPIAVLGPTNTGKTYLAVERMLGHRSGMIGFPLRLLAREIYDRVVARAGVKAAALITGEEQRLPANPRYFLCTVESMPLERSVEFLAIDEIQLAGEPERGHVFTDRLLRARGREETMFLGSETIRPLIKRLVPDAVFVSRPRFSRLTYAGPRKLTRLAPRSAIVAFSVEEVYAIAELMRRHRGGAAVVLGALSPSTRNAQVALFEAGEVDYLVATDAIGMGLNMGVSHIAFASLTKFDGTRVRRLKVHEMAQIAGRAGRHMNDGTFGTSTELGPLAPELIEALENHRFEPLRALHWRSPELRFGSIAELLSDLAAPPPVPALVRAPDADDTIALALLARDPEVSTRAQGAAAVRLLWDVCRVPDFRKLTADSHAQLLKRVYLYLSDDKARLPRDFIAQQLTHLERTDGDIDALTARIAAVRTWTYIAHRSEWLEDAAGWQERARALEDTLSDSLHERLTQRFVDRRTAHLVRRMRGSGELLGAIKRGGDVVVEGHVVGRIEGFRFALDPASDQASVRTLKSAAQRILARAAPQRVEELCAEDDSAFALDVEGRILWRDAAVARLAAGSSVLNPRIAVFGSDLLDGTARERVRRRLMLWLERLIERELAVLVTLDRSPLKGAARGLAYQLVEALGTLPRARAVEQVDALDDEARTALAGFGVRFGRLNVFLHPLTKPRSRRLRALLWCAHAGHEPAASVPPPERVSHPVEAPLPEAFYRAIGYTVLGPRAVRADIAERIAAEARRLARKGPIGLEPSLLAGAGCGPDTLPMILQALGFRPVETEDGLRFLGPRGEQREGGRRGGKRKERAWRPDRASPFTVLGTLKRPRREPPS